ncbi:rod-binding protein [Oricola cellulosilytica]|uniref:Flagellar protein FlgJ N-terminal domain-containing protein n=1 Tax=Oricola cellulosilytica TaxID=1429082 RepID=A0A4R0PL49_9HYPH|nr:rod-binding protein [Oricola cellulosilytica]TCD16229.1 hypothetical protein E0D97_02010 [Oricola cellulosilytica]
MAVEFPSDLILDVARAADPSAAADIRSQRAGAGQLARAHETTDATKVAKEFEALLVGNMISEMMGDGDESVFGEGFAGDMWKSMMAEHVAMAVVEGADFGVASKITKHFVRDGDTIAPVGGINDAAATPSETRSVDAARSGANEMSRDFIRKMLDISEPR